jgi:hypothetical protein
MVTARVPRREKGLEAIIKKIKDIVAYFHESMIPIICVLSRGLLQNVDRYLLGIKKLNINLQQFVNTVTPLLIGGILSIFFCSFSAIVSMFLEPYCFFSAVLMHVVSYAFYMSFRLWNVREVVITSKITDLLIAPACCFFAALFFLETKSPFENSNYLGYILGCCSFIPLLVSAKSLNFIKHPTSLFLMASMCIQILYAAFFKQNLLNGLTDGWIFTLGMLMWRTLFSSIQLMISFNKTSEFLSEGGGVWSIIGKVTARSCLMLVAYFTFVLSLELDKPMLTFPILNSAPLISIVLAKFMLKEKLAVPEMIAVVGLTGSALL